MKNVRLFLWLCVVAALGVGAILYQQRQIEAEEEPVRVSPVAGMRVGGPFTLTDHNGKTVTDKDFADKYRLVYFGFTYCPAVCPTELHKMTRALKDLGPALAAQIHPIFITIDPDRDTVPAMKRYMSLFDPSFTGLTGTPDQIARVLKDWKVYAAKVQQDGMSDYTMDHSSYIYFLSPSGDLLNLFRAADTADTMAQAIRDRLTQKAD